MTVYLYVFGCPDKPPYKVGFSASPAHRITVFAKDYEEVFTPDMALLMIASFRDREAAKAAENHAHRILYQWHLEDCSSPEWFNIGFDEVRKAALSAMQEFNGCIADVPTKAVTVGLSLNGDFIRKLDDLRRVDPRRPSRAEALRSLIEQMYEFKFPSDALAA
jgi:hypothetical protein